MSFKVIANNNGFKPCYKWNTFNTNLKNVILNRVRKVLNLVISGIPSIHLLTLF